MCYAVSCVLLNVFGPCSFQGVPPHLSGWLRLEAIFSSYWGYELAPLPQQSEKTSPHMARLLFVGFFPVSLRNDKHYCMCKACRIIV